jgi:hypothetical protein
MARCSRLCIAVIISACMLLCAIAQEDMDISKKQIVIDTIEKIRTGMDPGIRYEAAMKLGLLFRKEISPEEIDDKLLRDIISLLDLPEAEFGIVVALGTLGPRAKKAVPKLLKLLKKRDVCYAQSVSMAAVIRSALLEIGVTPPPSKCKKITLPP